MDIIKLLTKRQPQYELEKNSVEQYLEIENPEKETHLIKITKRGKWKNILFSFGKVKFKEEEGHCSVKFEYDIHFQGDFKGTKEDLRGDLKFNRYIGRILNSILEESFQSA